ncbi:MAG: hypothetical protein JXB38_15415 [Anaerolineales bacterium]|nr:hypothetical protein [Anaerolineales bacterium]
MSKAKGLIVLGLVLIVAMLACQLNPGGGDAEPTHPQDSPTEAAEEQSGPETQGSTDIRDLITDNILSMSIEATSDEGLTAGPIMVARVENNSDQPVEFYIPCGLSLPPIQEVDVQVMMIIEEVTGYIEPGDFIEIELTVICIEGTVSAPAQGDGYTIGTLVSGDMLKLAQCLCGEPLAVDSEDYLGVQFATWMVSEGDDFANLSDYSDGALADLLSEGNPEMGEDLQLMFDMIMQMMGANAEAILDKCDIDLSE